MFWWVWLFVVVVCVLVVLVVCGGCGGCVCCVCFGGFGCLCVVVGVCVVVSNGRVVGGFVGLSVIGVVCVHVFECDV